MYFPDANEDPEKSRGSKGKSIQISVFLGFGTLGERRRREHWPPLAVTKAGARETMKNELINTRRLRKSEGTLHKKITPTLYSPRKLGGLNYPREEGKSLRTFERGLFPNDYCTKERPGLTE